MTCCCCCCWCMLSGSGSAMTPSAGPTGSAGVQVHALSEDAHCSQDHGAEQAHMGCVQVLALARFHLRPPRRAKDHQLAALQAQRQQPAACMPDIARSLPVSLCLLTANHSGWHATRHSQWQLVSMAMLPGHRRHIVGCTVTDQAHPGLGEPVRYPDAAKACTSARACVATALDAVASRAVRPAATKSICSREPLSRWCQL